MTLTIQEGERPLFTHDYCSAYGQGDADLITDARGQHFVLLKHSEGHGTRATGSYLTVYGFSGASLHERQRFLTRIPAGFEANWILAYEVTAPSDGGLLIRGHWTVDGKLREGEVQPPTEPVVARIGPSHEPAL
jgi:hypothetical protein